MSEANHGETARIGSVKVLFRLEKDEDGYPPYEIESLWARSVGPDRYELDNIPFFAYGVSWCDVVSVSREYGTLYFNGVVRRGGHSTLRVIAFDGTDVTTIRTGLKGLGCSSELSLVPTLIAVDVPPTTEYDKVIEFLEHGVRANRWECEESSVVHQVHRSD